MRISLRPMFTKPFSIISLGLRMIVCSFSHWPATGNLVVKSFSLPNKHNSHYSFSVFLHPFWSVSGPVQVVLSQPPAEQSLIINCLDLPIIKPHRDSATLDNSSIYCDIENKNMTEPNSNTDMHAAQQQILWQQILPMGPDCDVKRVIWQWSDGQMLTYNTPYSKLCVSEALPYVIRCWCWSLGSSFSLLRY